jgi:hypothetical protein
MTTTKGIAIGLALLAVTGCAGPKLWTKAGGTQDEFARDKYDCLNRSAYTGQATYVNTYWGASQPQAYLNVPLYDWCMEARGWRIQR